MDQARVEYDAQGKRTTFDEIVVGQSLGEMEWIVTPEMVDTQCRLDLDEAWRPASGASDAEPIALPQIQYRPPRWLLSRAYNVRGLLYRWKMENLRPIRPHVKLRVTAWVTNKYVKNDREFVVFAAEATDPEGLTIFRTERTHVLDMLSRSTPRDAAGIDSGIKREQI